MNRVTKRTWLMGLFIGVLLGGMLLFLWEYATKSQDWITSTGSPHVYNSGNIGCGTITDRTGDLLLDITGKRAYSENPTTRRSTLHWLGDRPDRRQALLRLWRSSGCSGSGRSPGSLL